jgi:hypothetical protein
MTQQTQRRAPLAQARWARVIPYALLTLLSLPAWLPLWSVPFWSSHDGLHHVFRLANFDWGIRDGAWYPRWADGLGFGYGFPVTHYYAPLAYYVAEWFHLSGFGFLDSIKWVYAIGFIVAAWGMYRLAREVLDAPAAFLAAVAYAYYPYHLADMYMRGTLTEFLALAWLPWIVWRARRLSNVQAPTSHLQFIINLSLPLAALILTHNLSAFLFLPCLTFYFLLIKPTLYQLMGFATAVILAFALTAFYWLPAISEVAWIRAGQVSSVADDLATLLTPVTQFFSTSWLYEYAPDAPASLQHPLSLIVTLLSIAALIITWRTRTQLTSTQRHEWLTWTLIAILTIFAMLDWSAPLWTNVRALSFVQFPYRLHAVLSLALALVIGFGAQGIRHWIVEIGYWTLPNIQSLLSNLTIPIATLALVISALGSLQLTPQGLPGHKEPLTEAQINRAGMSDYDYQTALWARLHGGVWLLEYMPAWVTAAREEFFLPRQNRTHHLPPLTTARIEWQAYRSVQRTARVSNAEPFTLSFATFYFPLWQIYVDGQAAPTFPSGSLALVSADVPAGDHTITLTLTTTPLQRVGEWLAGLSGIFVIGYWILATAQWRLRTGYGFKPWRSLALKGFVAALIGVIVIAPFARAYQPETLQSLNATFDQQIDLLGYSWPRNTYRAGETLELTLYWFARQSPTEDFKVFVHLDPATELRANGVTGRAGQTDAQPGFNFMPTTRWQRGELIADHYRVKIADQAAPGTYEIFTGMYRQRPVQNLPVVSAQATPDNRVQLGAVTIGQ